MENTAWGLTRKGKIVRRSTAELRDAFVESFQEVGGKDWLVKVALDDPKLYAKLFMHAFPREILVSEDGEFIDINDPDADA